MNNMSFPFSIEPWITVQENKEYKTPIFNLLHRKMYREKEGAEAPADFYVLEAPEWVNVIPLTSRNEVILVEQYRAGTQEPTLEIPGGMVDKGEEPLQGARRELYEETGYQSDHWKSLGKASSNPAIMTNYTHMYVAEECECVGANETDVHEHIEVHKIPIKHFLRRVEEGAVHHAIVLAAVARYLLKNDG